MLDHDNLSPDKHVEPETKQKHCKKKKSNNFFIFEGAITDLTIQCRAALGDAATWRTTVVTSVIENTSAKERKH